MVGRSYVCARACARLLLAAFLLFLRSSASRPSASQAANQKAPRALTTAHTLCNRRKTATPQQRTAPRSRLPSVWKPRRSLGKILSFPTAQKNQVEISGNFDIFQIKTFVLRGQLKPNKAVAAHKKARAPQHQASKQQQDRNRNRNDKPVTMVDARKFGRGRTRRRYFR